MSGCMIFFHGVAQIAHKAALGTAAMCGNGSTPPAEISLSNRASTKLISDWDTDHLPDEPRDAAETDGVSRSDVSLLPILKPGEVAPVTAASPAPLDGVAASETLPPTGEVGTEVPSGDPGNEVLHKGPDSNPLAQLSRGGLTLGLGYSSVQKFNAEARITRSNLGGVNRAISASARYSKTQTLFELGYTDGNFLGKGVTFAPSLFTNRLSANGFGSGRQSTPFSQSARGFNLLLNLKTESDLSLSANYRLSADSFQLRRQGGACDSGVFGSPICGALGKTTSSILSLALTLDRRDSATDPTRGFKLRLAQDLAGLGGSNRYSRTRFSGEAHVGLGGEWTLSLGAEAGFVAPIRKSNIPLFERFYIGGTSMRGFDLRGIGPKIIPAAAKPGQSVAIGARTYYAMRAELAVPVGGALGRSGLQPSVFVDVGSAFGARRTGLLAGESLIGNSAKPRVSVGVGLAMNTPAGKLRLDFAHPLVKQFGDRSRVFSISFGASI